MHLRLIYLNTIRPQSWGDGAPLATIEQVMQDGIDRGVCDGMYVDVFWFPWEIENELVVATGAANGSLIFVDVDTSTALMYLPGTQITASKIADNLRAICELSYNEETGDWVNPDGTPWGFGSGQGQAGCLIARLPLIGPQLDFLCGIEKFLWLALTGFSILKTAESATQGGRAGWGTLAAFSGLKTIEAFKP